MGEANTLSALIERCEKATSPDRELDRAIWRALGGQVIPITERGGHCYERWIDNEGVRWTAGDTKMTASLDASLALVERLIPGADWKVRTLRHRKGFGADIYPTAVDVVSRADATTAPLAILTALLNALSERESKS